MPDAGTIRKHVEARIAEIEAILEPLRAEHNQLKAVTATFGPNGAAAAPAVAAVRRRSAARAGKPVPSGLGGGPSRAQQAVALITAEPGVTAADLARALGISRNYLYRILPRLEAGGVVTKQGMGYHPAAAAKAEQGA